MNRAPLACSFTGLVIIRWRVNFPTESANFSSRSAVSDVREWQQQPEKNSI